MIGILTEIENRDVLLYIDRMPITVGHDGELVVVEYMLGSSAFGRTFREASDRGTGIAEASCCRPDHAVGGSHDDDDCGSRSPQV